MGKHAYLIIAHKDDLTYRTLLQLLDDPHNDIYVHMDKKNKEYQVEQAEHYVRKSRLVHTIRTSVSRGGYSLVNAEMLLLEKAVTDAEEYDYYHLLSGQDLPIKSQDYIHEFFERNYGKEFVTFDYDGFDQHRRVSYYHFFQEQAGHKDKGVFKWLNRTCLRIQKLIGFQRNKEICFRKGTQWFSITDELARYVVTQKKYIHNVYRWTFCSDEVFLQTLVHNSEFKDRLYVKEYDNSNRSKMRLIDWNRGHPYTFRDSDFEEIKASEMLFARKFDANSDDEIIRKVVLLVQQREKTN